MPKVFLGPIPFVTRHKVGPFPSQRTTGSGCRASPSSVQLLQKHQARYLVVEDHCREADHNISAIPSSRAMAERPTDEEGQARGGIITRLRYEVRKAFRCHVNPPLVQENNPIARADALQHLGESEGGAGVPPAPGGGGGALQSAVPAPLAASSLSG